MEIVSGLIYIVLDYWAVGQTIFANKIRIGGIMDLFFQLLLIGMFFGPILIPIALLKIIFKIIFGRKKINNYK